MKTLADFKRDAASGNIALELYERYGKSDIPEVLSGVRKISKVNTVGVRLINAAGKESSLDVDRASLVEYDGETLTIYEPGYRQPTEEEQAVLDGWKKFAEEYEKKNPYGNIYWKFVDYFAKSPCPWMRGYETIQGKKYVSHLGKVMDKSIKGNAILKYHIIRL